MSKRAFITGITGQDGSYLCELLLEKGYEVHGLVHRPDSLPSSHIGHLIRKESVYNRTLFLHNGAFEDTTHLRRMLVKAQPDEFYHLAGQSSPRISLELPEATVASVGMATLSLLEVLRDLPTPPKFFYASSSEVFGSPKQTPQNELTPIDPTTPYGAAKAFSHQMAKIYRLAYGLQTCSGILYNHESPRRSGTFVTMKIARAVAAIKKGHQKILKLGSLTGRRDWGWAPDYVKAMWMMLQLEQVDDFVLATGELHSVQDLVEIAFAHVGLNWRDYTRYDETLVTAVEPVSSVGDSSKAERVLGWKNTVPFADMIGKLVDSEMAKED